MPDKVPEHMKDELDTIPEKDILIEIMVELKTIRYGLQTGDFGELGTETTDPDYYECDLCGQEVKETNRENHAHSEHNYPKGLDPTAEFSKV